jgi:glycosyltransferase involved in cell wall biosynthesis
MADLKIIVISSVRPEPTMGGQLILHRHLIGRAGIQLEIFGNESDQLTLSSGIRRLFRRLGRTRFYRVAEDFWVLWAGRWLDSFLPRQVTQNDRTLVLTVAHGDVCMAAVHFARKRKLPLVTFFQDWWPDIPNVHAIFRKQLERDFQKLYHGSTVAFCVCGGMKTALGEHPRAPVLPDIPEQTNQSCTTVTCTARRRRFFKIFYFGNLFEYGPMLGDALKVLVDHRDIRLEVRGANPNWSADFRDGMQARGLWKDFAPRNELDTWLADADAFLIPMAFDGRLRRRMETSFPSKLIEFAQLGKPLVVWGPEYCSAVQWARKQDRALCVTDPDPDALRLALEELAASFDEQQRLAAAGRQAAQSDFEPVRIRAQFIELLREAVRTHKPRKA